MALRFLLVLLILLQFGCSGGGNDHSAQNRSNWTLRWNTIAVDASGRDHGPEGAKEQLGPVRSARAVAIAHIAMADAVAAITGAYRGYFPIELPRGEISLKAAISQAAHDSLVAMYPSQAHIFDEALREDLAAIGNQEALENGILVGVIAADQIVTARTNDGSELNSPTHEENYDFSPEPGRWRKDPLNPDQKPLTPNWKLVRPFTLSSAEQYRTPPPPALESEEYAASFEEVLLIGGDGVNTPTIRTPEQTTIGIFWAYDGTPSLCAPPRLYNQIATRIIRDHQLDLEETTRLLALVNIALADAGISSWESKYYYDYWRPVAGIREASTGTGPTGKGDGNPATESLDDYTPLGAPASNLGGNNFTPPFPAYPSGHATFGGALFQTLRNYFGTDEISFSFISDEFNGKTTDNAGVQRPMVERSFSSLSQAEEENGQSRIYLGIHWSFDKTAGIEQGRKVADHVFQSSYQQ